MKYKFTQDLVTAQGLVPEEHIIEADLYERDGFTYTFFRGKVPIGTYQRVRQVELAEDEAGTS